MVVVRASLTLAIVALSIPASWSQEAAPPLEDLLRQLASDSIEVRDRAVKALADRGAAVRKALEGELPKTSGEVRGRIQDVLARIDRRERIASQVGTSTLITLSARDQSLSDVFAELERQSGTRIATEKIPAASQVTLSLEKVPFWEALERICKASGRVMYDFDGALVTFRDEPYRERRRHLAGPFAVTFNQVERLPPGELPAPEEKPRPLRVEASISWEACSKPIFVRYQVAEFSDDRGFALEDLRAAGGGSPWLAPLDGRQRSAWHIESVPITEQAKKLVRYRLSVEFDFALRWSEVKFEKPAENPGAEARCQGFAAKLGSFGRSSSLGDADLDLTITAPRGLLSPTTYDFIWIHGKSGKQYCGSPRETDPRTGGRRYVLSMQDFHDLGDDSPFEELSIRVPLEIHTERLEVDLKDVPLN